MKKLNTFWEKKAILLLFSSNKPETNLNPLRQLT